MAKDRSLVRASDIGSWAYCSRAWYLAQVRHVPHSRPEVLQRGTEAHVQHGQKVRHSGEMQRFGIILIALGVFLVVALMVAALMGWN